MDSQKAQIGVIGLGTMGANLTRNLANHGYTVGIFNRTQSRTNEFLQNFGSDKFLPAQDLQQLVTSLQRPRKIILLVKDGEPTDEIIRLLSPLLQEGDIIIDCGNSYYKDTIRRESELKDKNIRFIGSGLSGGEEGALNGPSLMPGGDLSAWNEIKPIFESIAARDFDGKACVTHVGQDGAGHFVKMVHNGIEYAIMQIMTEAYDVLKTMYKLPAGEIALVFSKINDGMLNSYLFQIAVDVLSKKDEFNQGYLIDFIKDVAGSKGTGKWTVEEALDRGIPVPTIASAVFARALSAKKKLRESLESKNIHSNENISPTITLEEFIPILEKSLYAAVLVCYAEGLYLITETAKQQNWQINLSEVVRIWQGGCIIRANVLESLENEIRNAGSIEHIFEIESIADDLKEYIQHLKKLVSWNYGWEIATPALSNAYNYFRYMTNGSLPLSLVQGLRDRFGAHTYERIDKKGNFHTVW